jgi:amidase
VLAFKPTFGALPRRGIYQLAASLDTVGVIARSVDDLRLATGIDEPAANLERPRIAFVPTPWWQDVDADARAAIEEALGAIEASGADLAELDLPELATLAQAQETVQLYESSASLRGELESHRGLISPPLCEAIEQGARIRAIAHGDALAVRDRHAAPLQAKLAAYDAVLTPSAHGAPPLGLEYTGDPLFSRAWNLLGLPAISLPLAWTTDGLPAGLQLLAREHADVQLLATAETLMARLGRDGLTVRPRVQT